MREGQGKATPQRTVRREKLDPPSVYQPSAHQPSVHQKEDRDSIWSIPLARRALYFGLFTAYALAGIGFLLWYEIFEQTADTWPETILSVTQGIGINTVGAAGLALLTIEGPRTIMVIGDYLKKRLIEPLEERRRLEAEQRREEAERRREEAEQRREEARMKGHAEGRAEGHAEGRAEGRAEAEAEVRAEWEAWNERRMAAEASGEPFDEPLPGTTSSTEGG